MNDSKLQKGWTQNGRATLQYPADYDEALHAVALTARPLQPGVFIREVEKGKNYVVLEFRDGNQQPLPHEVEYLYQVTMTPKAKRLLKEERSMPPKPANTVAMSVGPDQFVIDFGYFVPNLNVDEIPEHSLDVHTRVSVNADLARKLRDMLTSYVDLHDEIKPV